MNKNFKIVSLLTVFTLVLNVLSILVLMKPASALTGATDLMTRLQATTVSDHVVTVTTDLADFYSITIDMSAFTGHATATATVTSGAGTGTVSCTGDPMVCSTDDVFVSPVTITFGTGTLTNPVAGLVNVPVTVSNGDDPDESLTMVVAIVDSDQVLINGYIATSLSFDLDVGDGTNDAVNCALDECLPFGTAPDPAANYTVDLGNLTVGAVNESGVSVTHTDGDGTINYIYFDLSTNAASGAVLTMQSVGTRPGYLDGPGTLTEDIPSVADGGSLTAGVAGYGYKWGTLSNYSTNYYDSNNLGIIWTLPVSGSGNTSDPSGITINTNCDTDGGTYCAIPTTATSVFATDGSIEGVRGKLALGASIDGTMVPGTYRDTLQFIATSTF